MEEIWKDVAGYEGLYQVSNFGRVKRLPSVVNGRFGNKTLKGGMMKPILKNNGYLSCGLCKDHILKSYLIHRLVAIAFIPNSLGLKYINHKDSVRTNNNVSNLEWCTVSYNNKYAYDNNNKKDKMNWPKGSKSHLAKSVCAYKKDGSLVYTFGCISDAEITLGIKVTSIINCLKGRSKSAGGYFWKYNN